MAKHQYVSRVLFEDDDSEVDEYKLNGFRSRIPSPMPKRHTDNGNLTAQEQQKQLTTKKIQDIEKRTLESATRSLNLLHETGEIGIRSAKDLVSQGEKLQQTNTRLEEIDSHLKQSQKDINGIKSVFSGIKKIISGKSRSPSPCRRHISPLKKKPIIGKSRFHGPTEHLPETVKVGDSLSLPTPLHVQSSAEPFSSHQVDDILEANLEGIAHHITELKKLGEEFGKEIDHQNVLIDILQDKVEQADIKISQQNKDMNKILGK